MPYPESCPECGSTFRNTGTHFTARRNEVGRHVLLELGCQNTTRRFWWDFTTGNLTEDGRPSTARRAGLAETASVTAASNGSVHAESNGSLHAETNGHGSVTTLELGEEIVSATLKVADSPAVDDQTVLEPVLALEAHMEPEPALAVEPVDPEPRVDPEPQFVTLAGAPGAS